MENNAVQPAPAAVHETAPAATREPAPGLPPAKDDPSWRYTTVGRYLHNAARKFDARVLEIPTPRWSTYWAAKLGLPPNPKVPTAIQQRAWTSPIWYTPAK